MNKMRLNSRKMQMAQLYFFLMSNQRQNYLIYYRFSKGALV